MTNPEFVKFVNQLAEKTGKKSLCEAVLKGYKICCEQTHCATDYYFSDDEVADNDNAGLPQGTDFVFKPEVQSDETDFKPVPRTVPLNKRANTKLFRNGTWVAGGGIENDPDALERAATALAGPLDGSVDEDSQEAEMDYTPVKPTVPFNKRANTKLFRNGTWISGGGIENDPAAMDNAANFLGGSIDDGELKPVEFDNW